MALILGLRLAFGEEQTLPAALGMFALYVITTLGARALVERRLLREILAYVRWRPAAGAAA